MALSDQQLVQRLQHAATDAHLSGDDVKHLWLSQAAARLHELSNAWHPSVQASNGVTITDVQIKLAHQYADLIDEMLNGGKKDGL